MISELLYILGMVLIYIILIDIVIGIVVYI